MPDEPSIPLGLCQCGCGQQTTISPETIRRHGYVKGQPRRYVRGHSGQPTEWFIEDAATGCWLWQKGLNAYGYGVYCEPGTRRRLQAHRVIYEDAVGPIPIGLDLDHLCRNRRCVNPGHLEPVTRAENLLRGRIARGVRGPKTPA